MWSKTGNDWCKPDREVGRGVPPPGRCAMTRVTFKPQASFITTFVIGLLLLAATGNLLVGWVRQPIYSATVTTAPFNLRRLLSATSAIDTTTSTTITINNSNRNVKHGSRLERRHRHQHDKDDLSLWIDQQQVKMFSGKSSSV